MINKILYTSLAALLLPILAFTQVTKERDVVASAGEYSTSPAVELSWTVGDLAVATLQGGSLIVTQGFQQADENMVGIAEPTFPGDIKVYPNPVADQLYFEISSDTPMDLRGDLYDLTGRRVMDIPSFRVNTAYNGQIDLSHLPAGKWLLRFTDETKGFSETFSVTKVR